MKTIARSSAALCAATAVALCVLPVLASAQEAPRAPIHVTVQGRAIGWADIDAFTRAVNALNYQPLPIRVIKKEPTDMPSDARYVSYQGREPGSAPTEIIWISSDARPFADPRALVSSQRAYEEYVVAMALAVMDDGTAGSTLEAIYTSTPANRADRFALGESFAKALATASDESVAFASKEAQWIRSHITPGMTRAAAYKMLRSQGLTAYNYAFVKGLAIPRVVTNANRVVLAGGCDRSNPSSGAWPYQREPLPKQEGACAQMFARTPASIPNPDADVTLGGAFNLACSLSTRIVLSFTIDDRVKAVNVGEPTQTCE
jgi:hypothetical protein